MLCTFFLVTALEAVGLRTYVRTQATSQVVGSNMPSVSSLRSPSIRCELSSVGCEKLTHGILTISSSVRGAEKKWRAVLRVVGEQGRYFGTRRSSAVESTEELLDRVSARMSDEERSRILAVVLDFHERGSFSAACPERIRGSQPSKIAGSSECVSLIHQMFGIFRDDKPMSRLFENSLRRWRQVAQQMGAKHHLWTADEVDALICQRYPEHWDMYRSVAFPEMRSDIGRIAILHSYGGLYADLDVYPNRPAYSAAKFAVKKVHEIRRLTAKKQRRTAKTKPVASSQPTLDMQVLVGRQGNSIFLRWLDYIREQIARKDYSNSSHWQKVKLRYIWQTTGPLSMTRFLRLPENAEDWSSLKFLLSNHAQESSEAKTLPKRSFDVLSHPSHSSFDGQRLAEFNSRVGDGQSPVPVFEGSQPSVRRRLRGKTKREPCDPTRVTQGIQTEEMATLMMALSQLRKKQEKEKENSGKRWKSGMLHGDVMMERMRMLDADRDGWHWQAVLSSGDADILYRHKKRLQEDKKGLEKNKKQLELQLDRETLRADTYKGEVSVLRTFLREQGHAYVNAPEPTKAVSCKSEQ